MSLYAGMMRAGIPMRECDDTDLARYLRVLAHASKSAAKADPPEPKGTPDRPVVELRRGTIDQIWR